MADGVAGADEEGLAGGRMGMDMVHQAFGSL